MVALVEARGTGLGSGRSKRMMRVAMEGAASPGMMRDSKYKARWRRRIRVGGAHDEHGGRREGACVTGVSERREQEQRGGQGRAASGHPDAHARALSFFSLSQA